MSQAFFPTSKNIFFHSWSHICQRCTIHHVIISTPLRWNSCPNCRCYMWKMGWSGLEWLGKTFWYYQCQIENPCKWLKFMNYLQIHLWAPSKKGGIVVVPMWKPMAHSFSFTLDSSILDELKSQTLLRPPFWNVWKCKKLGNVNKIVCESPTLLATTKHGQSSWWIAHDWHPKHNMSSTKHVMTLKWTNILIGSSLVVLG
jgi:hypothetical protein